MKDAYIKGMNPTSSRDFYDCCKPKEIMNQGEVPKVKVSRTTRA